MNISDSTAQTEARRMLDAFTSVGANRFHVTFTSIREEQTDFLKNRTVPSMRYNLPAWVRRAATLQPYPLPATENAPEETVLAGEILSSVHTPPRPLFLSDWTTSRSSSLSVSARPCF
jgi:hypothetical protein